MSNPTNFWDVATPIIAILAPVITVWINNRHHARTERLRWVRKFKREAYKDLVKQLSDIHNKSLYDGIGQDKHSELLAAITSFYAVIEHGEPANEFRAFIEDFRERFQVAKSPAGQRFMSIRYWKEDPDFDTLIDAMLDLASNEIQGSAP